jgi:hypothetical protein
MEEPMTRIVSYVRSAAAAASLITLAAGSAGAQQLSGSWQGWLGCWTAGPAIGGISPSSVAPLVCITPTSDANVVEVTTISEEKVVATQRIDASGRELPMEAKGCTGTQRAQWSADGRRVYLKAVGTCDGAERVTSGIIAMSPAGEWLDVQGVSVGKEEGVRVARYRDAGVPSSVPAEVAATLRDRGVSTQSARFIAGGTVGSSAVIEASRAATPAVVEAWLLERGQNFGIDAAELVRLADAGVPARVTDALVAVSNPGAFAMTRADEQTRNRGRSLDDEIAGRRIYVFMDPAYSPYRWGYNPYAYGYGPYGYSPLGYRGYGYGYGSGYYGYPGYVPPVVIVNPGQTAQPRGQAVRGRGYTQPDASPTTAQPSSTRASERSSSSGASSSSGSSSGSSSQPRSEPAPRTAHPKP